MKYEYRAEGFNCGICKVQGKETTNLMRPVWNHSRYNQETGEFIYFKDEDVSVMTPITSRFLLNKHKRYEHREEFKEAEKKARETRRSNPYRGF